MLLDLINKRRSVQGLVVVFSILFIDKLTMELVLTLETKLGN